MPHENNFRPYLKEFQNNFLFLQNNTLVKPQRQHFAPSFMGCGNERRNAPSQKKRQYEHRIRKLFLHLHRQTKQEVIDIVEHSQILTLARWYRRVSFF